MVLWLGLVNGGWTPLPSLEAEFVLSTLSVNLDQIVMRPVYFPAAQTGQRRQGEARGGVGRANRPKQNLHGEEARNAPSRTKRPQYRIRDRQSCCRGERPPSADAGQRDRLK